MFISPVYNVRRIEIEKIEANDYNPNKVATKEMELLYISIKNDGYTQPVVCWYDEGRDKYVIVDGFHRYSIMRKHSDIYKREGGCLPVVILNGTKADYVQSTIRHNRARGKHSVCGNSAVVVMLKKMDLPDNEIMKGLGMEWEEYSRLLGILGIRTEVRDLSYSISKQLKDAGSDTKENDY